MLDMFLIWAVALIIFLVIDLIWLGAIAKNMYKKEIGHLMSDRPNWIAAIVFYMFYIFGLVFFVISPAIEAQNVIQSISSAIFFGALTYGTYDLTNLATLKRWPIKLTVTDIVWGSMLCAIVSASTYYIFV